MGSAPLSYNFHYYKKLCLSTSSLAKQTFALHTKCGEQSKKEIQTPVVLHVETKERDSLILL